MNDKFFDLKKEKQDKIINAALKIFTKSDYRRASTDDIVKEAGISKGLLFHYFNSKAGLYDFIYAYSAKYLTIELYQTVSIKETDFFELLKQIENAHLRVMKQYPYMITFLKKAEVEEDIEVFSLVEKKRIEYQDEYNKIFGRADMTGWKDGIDVELAKNIIFYTIKGIEESFVKKNEFIPEELIQNIVNHLNLIKSSMYELDESQSFL